MDCCRGSVLCVGGSGASSALTRRNWVCHRFSKPLVRVLRAIALRCLLLSNRLTLSVASVALNMAGGFEALGLAPELVRAVTEDLGYLLPTNVQASLASR